MREALSWRRRIVLVSFGLVSAFALGEGACRWYYPTLLNMMEYDEALGFRRPANHRGVYRTEEFTHEGQLNGGGFNDMPRESGAPEGVVRIALLGDSIVEGIQVPYQDTSTQQMAKILTPHCKVEVRNYGVSGYGTYQEYLLYEREVRQFKPHLVILSFLPANDLRNNSQPLEEGSAGAPRSLRPYLVKEGDAWRERPPVSRFQFLMQRGVKAALLRYSRLVAVIHERWRGFLPTPLNAGGAPSDFDVYRTPLSLEWEDAWQVTGEVLRRLRSAVAADGGELFTFAQPVQEEIVDAVWEWYLATYPRLQDSPLDRFAPHRRLNSVANELGIPSIDMVSAFRAAVTSRTLFFRRDGHLTPEGHSLVARTVVDALRSWCEHNTAVWCVQCMR